ncbi:hypothetical protein PHBOTO_002549 [Pseudozyma hubeiensis]|nr:hypothetical protein PHBOTO_002549 [Pseudozyma hubeiensis]
MPGRSQTGTNHPFLNLHPSPSNSGEYATSIDDTFRSWTRSKASPNETLLGDTVLAEKRCNCKVPAVSISENATTHAPTASWLDLLDGLPHVQFEQKNTGRASR